MNNQFLKAAVLAVLGTAATLDGHAATLNNGDILTITTPSFDPDGYVIPDSGSYYGVDGLGNSTIAAAEMTPLSQGTTGLVIGVTSTPGASHSGYPTAGDTNAVTAPDYFFSDTGSWYFTIAPTGGTDSGLDMSGWNWAWNGISSIPLGSGAWQPANCATLGCAGYTFTEGIGRLQWDGVYGDPYTLDFASTVAPGDPSGFGGVHFYTHLQGVVAVPEPAPAWLFGSALLVLLGMARTRKSLRTPISGHACHLPHQEQI